MLSAEREQVAAREAEAELAIVGELQVRTMEDVEQLQQVEHVLITEWDQLYQ